MGVWKQAPIQINLIITPYICYTYNKENTMKNLKTCTKCSIEKELSEFHKTRRSLDGHESDCKNCRKEKAKTYYLNNKEKINKQHKQYRDSHKAIIYARNSKWIKENKELVKKLKVDFYTRHPHYDRDYVRNKRKINLQFRIKQNLSRRVLFALQKNWKSKQTLELLGCSIKFLKQHLESQFTEGMRWSNYGKGGWVIDHIKPCISFDLSKSEEQHKCFNFSNLQPLWEVDNLSKGAKIL
jgi:hypothetical protein